MPTRIQMTRQRPWRHEHPDAVIVARPTYWGNPYAVRRSPGGGGWWAVETEDGHEDAETRDEAIALAVERYRQHLDALSTLGVLRSLDPLRGRDLACWCPLDSPCHGDVLLELANGGA